MKQNETKFNVVPLKAHAIHLNKNQPQFTFPTQI